MPAELLEGGVARSSVRVVGAVDAAAEGGGGGLSGVAGEGGIVHRQRARVVDAAALCGVIYRADERGGGVKVPDSAWVAHGRRARKLKMPPPHAELKTWVEEAELPERVT